MTGSQQVPNVTTYDLECWDTTIKTKINKSTTTSDDLNRGSDRFLVIISIGREDHGSPMGSHYHTNLQKNNRKIETAPLEDLMESLCECVYPSPMCLDTMAN